MSTTQDRLDAERRRLYALDFRDLPAGHYALPVHEYTDDDETEPALLGYRVFARTAARVTAAGHRLGHDTFTAGASYAAPGIDPARLAAEIRRQRADLTQTYGLRGDIQNALDHLLADVRHRDVSRPAFGRITGKCGCCGRRLTDSNSKARGIGPECAKNREGASR